MVRNVVFDMGNVLSDYNPRKYAESLLEDPEAADAVVKELFGGPEWLLLDAGTIEESYAVSEVQKRIPQFAEAVATAMDHWRCVLDPVPGMPELVDRIRQNGYRLYLLSNVSLRFLRFYGEVAMFRHFDGFLISAEEKLVKPDPAIYRRLCEKFELLPSECLFIDDMQENIDEAVRQGFQGHRFAGAEELERFLTGERILT
ncbi:HAD family phosphatase [Caproiciproducens sp. NJN-50]|uniref:HAD family hydrolase n=1 Tax=Acutalibacteraceae TaxID=3082771 RepID=UPI000FFE0A4C|nr:MULTISPECIES: HAD family phosphatase [Acutalibacteraceae]QAT49732.1 HAD family phosphatase [Caproiciproducens sp. NJN-50]